MNLDDVEAELENTRLVNYDDPEELYTEKLGRVHAGDRSYGVVIVEQDDEVYAGWQEIEEGDHWPYDGIEPSVPVEELPEDDSELMDLGEDLGLYEPTIKQERRKVTA